MYQYDYIITGAGCAGLSLLVRMIRSGGFSGKKILLIDKAEKIKNDRTWCFWEEGEGFFEPIVHKQWDKVWFHGTGYSALKDMHPYRYKMIRGIDFYNYCFDIIKQQQNITVQYGDIEKIHSDTRETFVIVHKEKITASYIFNSILFESPALKKNQFNLMQHFKGWVIEANKNVFNPGEATLMDFRVSQQYGTAFVYIMPFSASAALVEYTLFTEALLDQGKYDEGLKAYIDKYPGMDKYIVREEEFGIIPMTNYSFPARNNNIIFIGTAGGRTKASTGYTFQFIQKQSGEIISALLKTGKVRVQKNNKRFAFYDSVLLNVLATGKMQGDKIFTDMFSKNTITDIFSFLDNESSLMQDMRVISTLPTMPFLRAGLQQFL